LWAKKKKACIFLVQGENRRSLWYKKIVQEPTEILVEIATDSLDRKLKCLAKKKAKFLVATGYNNNERILYFKNNM
jgi:hypothetical protein